MTINKKRYKDYKKEIAGLQKDLDFHNRYKSFKAKMFDLLDRKQWTVDEHDLRNAVTTLFGDEYLPFVKECIRDYDTMLDIVNTLYKDIGVDVSREFSKLRSLERINRNRLGDYGDEVVDLITREVRKGLSEGMKYKELIKHLKPVDGKVENYAHAIARTQAKGYSRACKSEKARIGEVYLFEYVGAALQGNSHLFCKYMLGMTCHIDDIVKMYNGTGLPVLDYCGGWNCVHDWEPDPFAKEKDKGSWQRNTIGKATKIKVYSRIKL